MTEAGRPQDQGRRHRAAGKPSPATATLLGEYQEAMRAELRAVLVELRGKVPPAGLLDQPGDEPPVERPPLRDRAALWDLAIKLGRELGTEVDPRPIGNATTSAAPAARRRRGRVEY